MSFSTALGLTMGRTGWRLWFPGYLFSTACSRLGPEEEEGEREESGRAGEREESGRAGERGHDPHPGCEQTHDDDLCSRTWGFVLKPLVNVHFVHIGKDRRY